MNCKLDSIKNNRLVQGSLVVVGLTAVGAVAHRLGLLTLCSKALSTACGHVTAVVQRHRFVSALLAFAAVGTVCLVALAAVVRSRKSEGSSPSQPQEVPTQPSQSSKANSAITAQARTVNLLGNYTNVEELINDFYFPSVFGSPQEWNPIFGTIYLAVEDYRLQKMIETVLDAYLKGEEIPFCEFFDPAYLTIKPEESNRAQSAQIQQSRSTSIFPASVETQRMIEYGNLLEAIIKYYHNEVGADILPGDSFSYRFEITIGSEKTPSIGYHHRLR